MDVPAKEGEEDEVEEGGGQEDDDEDDEEEEIMITASCSSLLSWSTPRATFGRLGAMLSSGGEGLSEGRVGVLGGLDDSLSAPFCPTFLVDGSCGAGGELSTTIATRSGAGAS